MSYRLFADDMAALVQALGLHKPLIFGCSDGGQVALELGMRYPICPRRLSSARPGLRSARPTVPGCGRSLATNDRRMLIPNSLRATIPGGHLGSSKAWTGRLEAVVERDQTDVGDTAELHLR